MNINKYIAQSGLTSRRGADDLIKAGKVKINEKIAKPINKVKDGDKVFVNDKEISLVEEKIYLAFNKPVGVITTSDPSARRNIMSVLKYPKRVFPVGRLDVNSQGLILLTNDGELAQEIMKGKKVEKEYLVYVDKTVTDPFLEKLERGVVIDRRRTLPAKIEQLSERHFSITLIEGRKRQIRRMCEKSGYNVTKLIRTRIGNIKLDDIKEGKYIELPPENIRTLLGL